MPEPFDIYSDSFLVSLSSWGASLSFQLSDPHPAPDAVSESTQLGTIRMSIEHLKVMTFLVRHYVIAHEGASDVVYDVPDSVLGQLGIPPGDWNEFWSK
jgi:hypothetical protein